MKKVVVTGVETGLGLALEKAFGEARHRVIGTVADSNNTNGYDRPYLRYPARSPMDFRALESAIEFAFQGRVDILVNNVGVNGNCQFEALTYQDIEQMIGVNCISPVLLTRQLLAGHYFGADSVVVNIVSEASWKPMRYSLAYNASKAALSMATKQMARELKGRLSVLGICPGFIKDTAMTEKVINLSSDLRGQKPKEFWTYWEASDTSGVPHQPANLARLIVGIATSPEVHAMSGAMMDVAG